MTVRATSLAEDLEEVLGHAIGIVDGCSADALNTECEAGGRTVGQVAYHLSDVCLVIGAMLRTVAQGEEFSPIDYEGLDARNAKLAEGRIGCTGDELAAALGTNGRPLVDLVRSLGDHVLDARREVFSGLGPFSSEDAIKILLIGHFRSHISDLQAALRQRTSA